MGRHKACLVTITDEPAPFTSSLASRVRSSWRPRCIATDTVPASVAVGWLMPNLGVAHLVRRRRTSRLERHGPVAQLSTEVNRALVHVVLDGGRAGKRLQSLSGVVIGVPCGVSASLASLGCLRAPSPVI